MGVGAGLYIYDVDRRKKLTFAISSPDEFLYDLQPGPYLWMGKLSIISIGLHNQELQ